MKEFEDDIVDAFKLIVTFGFAITAVDLFRERFPQHLGAQFDGLLPAQDTEAQRASTKNTVWPPADVRFLIDGTGSSTVNEFLNSIRPMVDRHLNRQVFVLLTTALDSFLDRKGFGLDLTLGPRFEEVKKQRTVPSDLEADMREIIRRRNDVAHGGVVTTKYMNLVTSAHQSGWIAKHGIPRQAGALHHFDPEYLYWATSGMYRLAKLC